MSTLLELLFLHICTALSICRPLQKDWWFWSQHLQSMNFHYYLPKYSWILALFIHSWYINNKIRQTLWDQARIRKLWLTRDKYQTKDTLNISLHLMRLQIIMHFSYSLYFSDLFYYLQNTNIVLKWRSHKIVQFVTRTCEITTQVLVQLFTIGSYIRVAILWVH